MKLWIGSAFLCLLIAAPTFARQEQQQDEKPKQQQDDKKSKQQQDEKQKPPQEPKADKRQQEQPARQQDDKAKQEDKKQEKQDTKQQEKQQKEMEKQQKTQTEQQRPPEQRQTQQQRAREQRPDTEAGRNQQYAGGGDRGRRIPDDRFREHFGREHHFHVGIHRGERQFAYGGYSFEFVDAWPAEWGYNDDFYVDYIDDQYYLCDLDHPEVRIVVIVVG